MILSKLLASMRRDSAMKNLKQVSVEEFLQAHTGDAIVIDVRNPDEYAVVHVEGAQLYPLPELEPDAVLSACGGGDKPIYVLCKAGGRARKAAEKLAPLTSREICVVAGGTDACVEAGAPLG